MQKARKQKVFVPFLLKTLAPAAGFEPATKWLTATYSTAELCRNKITVKFGSGSWIRTSDQVVNSHLLYR